MFRDAWVAQLIEHSALGFRPGHDLRVQGWSPTSVSVLSAETTKDSLPLPLPSPACTSACVRVHASGVSKIKKILKVNLSSFPTHTEIISKAPLTLMLKHVRERNSVFWAGGEVLVALWPRLSPGKLWPWEGHNSVSLGKQCPLSFLAESC